ncbi:MAG TPA: DUF6491 family protein [Steroidobacteraceae bacterium]|nr:DUF6491 family protein [Steroidobacteraceae bacterium]
MKSGIHPRRLALLLALTAGLMACSGIPRQDRDQAQLDRYLHYAGPPVDRITWLGRYDGWEALGQYQLVVWTNVSDAYLITVYSPCENLQFAQRIELTSTAHTVYQKFDSVIVRGWKCQIAEIRPVDYRRMRQDMRAEREALKAEQAKPAEQTNQ